MSDNSEIDAIAKCCEALEPIKGDTEALRRIYDYLKSRYPTGPVKRQDWPAFRSRAAAPTPSEGSPE